MRHSNTILRRTSDGGFTLIELLVVVMIIGLLAGLVAPRIFGRIGKSKQSVAQAQIEMLGVALDNYSLDIGQYPTTDQGLQSLQVNPNVEGWDGPYLKKEVPVDPWGNPYVYRAPGRSGGFEIVSYGADGLEGGSDEAADVESWSN